MSSRKRRAKTETNSATAGCLVVTVWGSGRRRLGTRGCTYCRFWLVYFAFFLFSFLRVPAPTNMFPLMITYVCISTPLCDYPVPDCQRQQRLWKYRRPAARRLARGRTGARSRTARSRAAHHRHAEHGSWRAKRSRPGVPIGATAPLRISVPPQSSPALTIPRRGQTGCSARRCGWQA
jgi:hypothetical protein